MTIATEMKILRAEYLLSNDFHIPDSLDLTKYKYWVKWDTLYVEINKTITIEIQPIDHIHECSDTFKYPNKTSTDTLENDYYDLREEDDEWALILDHLEHPADIANLYEEKNLLLALNWGTPPSKRQRMKNGIQSVDAWLNRVVAIIPQVRNTVRNYTIC